MRLIKNKVAILMFLLIGGMVFAESCKTSGTPNKKCGCGEDINGVYKHHRRAVY